MMQLLSFLKTLVLLGLVEGLISSKARIQTGCRPVFSSLGSETVDKVVPGSKETTTTPPRSRIISWRNPNWKVHYEQKGDTGPVLLLLPGFGVGTFHYSSQLEVLSKSYRVYSIDLLGQGKSWPIAINPDDSLCFSTDLWVDQVIEFIADVIQEPVHVFGNSLGGFLAVHAAAKCPTLFKSAILANAAPFWAFQAPLDEERTETGEAKGVFAMWNGTLPAPEPLFSFGKAYFDIIRSRGTVESMLKGVYKTREAFDEQLVQDIITSASQPGGYEAFTSILFSPKTKRSFDESLRMMSQGIPVCLCYGRDDPWVIPMWAQRGYRVLEQTPMAYTHVYVEISNSGHSPNHETPVAVNAAVKAWIDSLENSSDDSADGVHVRRRMEEVCSRDYLERTGVVTSVTMRDGRARTLLERVMHVLG
jgi:pimeloyl-ACP methyl ester carboxylesterase